jgi:hypothetical protein
MCLFTQLILTASRRLHGEHPCWRFKQKGNPNQSSERQPAYFVVLKDRFGRSEPLSCRRKVSNAEQQERSTKCDKLRRMFAMFAA